MRNRPEAGLMSGLLSIEDLHVRFEGAAGPVRAVDGLSFTVERGETYGLVGESGCGKSLTALAILRLTEPGRITAGAIRFDGHDLLGLSEKQMRAVRGARIGIVFQEPAAALNPVMRVGAQVVEAIRVHRKVGRREAWREAVRLLGMVSLSDPAAQARAYPHELSGGMKQRAMLAIALACRPSLLIADEPTTALDVTIQAQILELLRRLRREMELTVLLISHDLGVVAENADRVGVMYAGRIVEEAPAAGLFADPRHPYTRGLLAAIPHGRAGGGKRRLATLPGQVPDPSALPVGCRFHPRCPERFEPCDRDYPAESHATPGRRVACHLYECAGVPRAR
ncbi:MAG TPA: ABC transporter ATP-binding protein [Candidatus Polarisedimenticolaceae bacterium]|nr:ABC transporter ATP-binding protein [Candidatus Polarisedimenticolaceae bacterium]